MALSLSDCFIARKVFEVCRHGGAARRLLLGVVHKLSTPAVFGAASARQSRSLNLLFSNSCHAFASISSSSSVEPALPEGEAARNWEGIAFAVRDSLPNVNAFGTSTDITSCLSAYQPWLLALHQGAVIVNDAAVCYLWLPGISTGG